MLLKVSMLLFILKIVRLFWQFYGHSLLKTKRMKNLIKYAQNQGGGKCPISNSPSSGRRTMRSETQKCREAYPTLQSRETCFWLKPSIRPTHAVNSFSEYQEEISVIMGSFNWLWEINISSMFVSNSVRLTTDDFYSPRRLKRCSWWAYIWGSDVFMFRFRRQKCVLLKNGCIRSHTHA